MLRRPRLNQKFLNSRDTCACQGLAVFNVQQIAAVSKALSAICWCTAQMRSYRVSHQRWTSPDDSMHAYAFIRH